MREVIINGKSVKIETGVPMPPRIGFLGRPKGDLANILETMSPGESCVVPIGGDARKSISSTLSNVGKRMGLRFGYRAEGDGTRVFCLPAKPVKAVQTVTANNNNLRISPARLFG